MRLRTTLFLIAAIPLASVVAMFAIDLAARFDDNARGAAIVQAVERGAVMSAAIHQLQRERGYSVGYVKSQGAVSGPTSRISALSPTSSRRRSRR